MLGNLGITCNIVRRRSEYRLQPEWFERRDFPAEAGTLNAVSRKSDVKRSSSAAPAAIELSRVFQSRGSGYVVFSVTERRLRPIGEPGSGQSPLQPVQEAYRAGKQMNERRR